MANMLALDPVTAARRANNAVTVPSAFSAPGLIDQLTADSGCSFQVIDHAAGLFHGQAGSRPAFSSASWMDGTNCPRLFMHCATTGAIRAQRLRPNDWPSPGSSAQATPSMT